MFMWKKLGPVFNPLEHQHSTWLYEYAQTPNTLEFDDFIRVYFTTRLKPNNDGKLKSVIAFVDLDKNNLFNILSISNEPVLHLGQKGRFDEFGTYLFAPIRLDSNHIYAYYVGVTCPKSVPINASIGLCESFDNAKTFSKIGVGPVLGHSLYEPFLVSSHKIRKYGDRFYLFYIAGYKWATKDGQSEPVYKIRLATSTDGITWDRKNQNILTNKLGDLEAQACPDVFYKNGKYHMFFCYRNAFDYRRNPAFSYRIGYACSTDLINWMREDSKAGINISKESNAFDSEMVAYPHIFELKNRIYMLYLGNEVGRYGFGLAELEGDLD